MLDNEMKETFVAFDYVFQPVKVPIHNTLAMVGAMMRTIMLVVTMMVVIVVDQMSGLEIAQNANAWEKI